MTIINVNSISGINSITAQGASGIEFYDSSGNLSGDITLGVGATIKGSSNLIKFDTGATIPVQVDSNGHVGIGTDNNTSAALDVHGDIRISRGSRGDGTGKIFFGSDSGDYLQLQDIGTGGNIFELVQDGSKKVVVRGTNGHLGIGTVTANNMLHIEGSSPSIRMKVSGGPRHMISPYLADLYIEADNDNTSANTNIIFQVDGGECARFDTNKNLKFPNGQGIDFSSHADQATGESNVVSVLDDYEEGTWDPTISQGWTVTNYDAQYGWYIKVGNLVTAAASIQFDGTSTNNQIKLSIPFVPGGYDNNNSRSMGRISFTNASMTANSDGHGNGLYAYPTYGAFVFAYLVGGSAATLNSTGNATNTWLEYQVTFRV